MAQKDQAVSDRVVRDFSYHLLNVANLIVRLLDYVSLPLSQLFSSTYSACFVFGSRFGVVETC